MAIYALAETHSREALAEIKAGPAPRPMPVIVLAPSKAEADVRRSHDLGANSFITKLVPRQG